MTSTQTPRVTRDDIHTDFDFDAAVSEGILAQLERQGITVTAQLFDRRAIESMFAHSSDEHRARAHAIAAGLPR